MSFEEKLNNIPTKSGVYLFKSKQGKVIYVGKAKRLRPRVRSYFQTRGDEHPKVRRLVTQIADLETIVTNSEMEALILEANLIKEYKPRYNVNLKDDKSYPYIRVTNEPFPRIFPTRKIIKDGSKYFGPYTDVSSMRSLLKTVKRLFPIRSCNLPLTESTIQQGKYKVCLNYHIHKCLGPCEGLIDAEEYAQIVKHIVDFINGRDKIVVDELQRKMEQAAENKSFEIAARIRDQINAIRDFQYKQKLITPDAIDQDVVAIAVEDDDACGLVMKIRTGRVIGRQHYYLSGVENETDSSVLYNFVMQYYLRADFIPGNIFLSHKVDNQERIEKWLAEKGGKRVQLLNPQRGERSQLVSMATQNARLLLQELQLQKMKAHDFTPHSVKALQRDLRLAKPPRRIEAFDISNISGTNATASVVTFVDGQAYKNDYRRFKIRTKSTPDDFAMMREAIERRYSRVLAEKSNMPDLIMVDGGKGQLSAALEILTKLNLQGQPIIALAKRLDEVFVPGSSDPQNIPRTSSGLRLLQQIRDESHRFAITYHRTLRGKQAVYSELDDIEGIGRSRKKLLIKHFGSLKKLKTVSLEEIRHVNGISESLAQRIFSYFHETDSTT